MTAMVRVPREPDPATKVDVEGERASGAEGPATAHGDAVTPADAEASHSG